MGKTQTIGLFYSHTCLEVISDGTKCMVPYLQKLLYVSHFLKLFAYSFFYTQLDADNNLENMELS